MDSVLILTVRAFFIIKIKAMTATRLVLLSAVLLGAALSVSLNTNYYYELHGDMELTEQKMRQMYVEYGQEF